MTMMRTLVDESVSVAEAGDERLCGGRVTMVSRAEWGARSPRTSPVNISVPVNMTFMHHSDMPWHGTNLSECIKQVKSIQKFHMDFRGIVRCSRSETFV